MKLHLDIETFSECDLKEAGLYKYAEHPSTELTVVCYAFDDGPVHVWLPYDQWDLSDSIAQGIRASKEYDQGAPIYYGTQCPTDLRDAVHNLTLGAHNAQYERVVLNGTAGDKVRFPNISIDQTHCTMAKCRAHGLPGSLEDAAKALGSYPKMATGRNVMLKFAKPRRKEAEPRWTPTNAPADYVDLVRYCIDDVKAERDIDLKVPDLSADEVEVYRMDQRMNDRGTLHDHENREHAQYLVDAYRKELSDQCVAMTRSEKYPEGLQPSQREKISGWVRENGWPRLTDMQADTVHRLTMNEDVPDNCRTMLKIYSTYGMKAVAKFDVMENMACADGRLRGMFQYHGAGTGRWSSMGVQLQNLMRPVIDDANGAIPLLKHRTLKYLRAFYEADPMKVLASTIRGMLVAEDGREFVALDYSGIEARIVAWIAGEMWKLNAFNLQDRKEGPDNYVLAYSRVFQIPVAQVTKAMRQLGKVIDLSMGFEGGVGALITMAAAGGVDINALAAAADGHMHEEALRSAQWMWDEGHLSGHGLPKETVILLCAITRAWRLSHPATADSRAGVWKQLKDAAMEAVENPGRGYTIDTKLVTFFVEGDWLYLRLPSGRRMAYYKPTVEGEGRMRTLYYRGVDTETRRWMKTATYGGKLMQNVAEGIGRDLLVNGMQQLEKRDVPMVMSIHDEAVGEQIVGNLDMQGAMDAFLTRPSWAAGLPLAAEGFIEKRYRK